MTCRKIMLTGSRHDKISRDVGGLSNSGPAAEYRRSRGLRHSAGRKRQSTSVRGGSIRGCCG